MAASREIVLYHYTFSPFARRIVWYLNLRRIPYSQCFQPPIMPRPDVKALGVEYRRIPILAIGRDIYLDTRMIIAKLERLFPASDAHPSIASSEPEKKGMERLLSYWIIDGGVFSRAGQLIPTSMPLLSDPKFQKDRENFSGRRWDKEAMEAVRPEALVEIQAAFAFLEGTLLADGRDWILMTENPTIADIEAVWPFHWLQGLKAALPPDLISVQQFPLVLAWIDRFQRAISAAKSNSKPKTLKGPEAVTQISSAEFAEVDVVFDSNYPSGLKRGQEVQVWPIDTGVKNRDSGILVGLSIHEIVIETTTADGKVVRIHTPRHGFRIRATGQNQKAKM